MHGLTLERWAQRTSPIHRLHAIAKIAATLSLLLSLSLADPSYAVLYLGCFLLLLTGAIRAKLPLGRLLLRGLIAAPFVAGVVALNFFSGDTIRSFAIFSRAYLSACTVALLLATTPFPSLLQALDKLRVPHFFLVVVHFLYRYLAVIYEQARTMRRSRQCRAPKPQGSLWKTATGILGTLFFYSYRRAERVHQALLARGFQNRLISLETAPFTQQDWGFLLVFFILLGLLQAASYATGPFDFLTR